MCKKPKNKDKNEFKLGDHIPLLDKAHPFCDNFDYMSCKMNVISSCFNTKRKFIEVCISKKVKPRTASPVKVERAYVSPKSSDSSHKTSQGAQIVDNLSNASKTYSSHAYVKTIVVAKNHEPKQIWVPKKT